MAGGGSSRRWWQVAVLVAVVGIVRELSKWYGWDKDEAMKVLRDWSDRLGVWAIPAYVGLHTLTLALCLPYAVFFEAAASLIFGFFPAVLCVFCAKVLGASLSFGIGRLVFRSSSSAMEWAQRNKYFHILSRGVERDVIGCLPMILQNTSIGSLAGAAVASSSGSQKSQVWSYLFPALGILSSFVISLRIKKYSTDISLAEVSTNEHVHDRKNDADSSQTLSNTQGT
ncbi:hypothetical protein I3760_05G099800 [Carya illinoinensis]|uniref:Uncharacterized protein n=1 Tax=Carya illinoinensis TaxID=32201 RepID=A0A8T1QH79_CARIL|nr:hypothetical protein I3760_05G099800 [Carya illinoinensis]KAG6653745.1 hypothetical protein CIPAW_05G097700 [Carya illinoinensis]